MHRSSIDDEHARCERPRFSGAAGSPTSRAACGTIPFVRTLKHSPCAWGRKLRPVVRPYSRRNSLLTMRRTHGSLYRLLWSSVPGAFCFALSWWVAAGAAYALTFAEVGERAKQLASSPYQKPATDLPKELQSLDYDQYWSIRYRPDKAYWRAAKLPFEVSFFHQGMYYDQPV